MKRFFVILSVLSIFSTTIAVLMDSAQAAALTSLKDTMTRAKISVASGHTIDFTTPTGIANTNTITLTFPAGSFTHAPGAVANVTIADGAGADNAVTSATWATPVLTITASVSSVVAAGHVAHIKIPAASAFTNPGSAGSYTMSIAGTFGDTGSIALAIANEDQVSSSGSVDPILTFDITDGTIAFGTLSTSIIKTDTASMTAGTNSTSGYNITIGINGTDTATLDDGAGHTITAIGAVAAASNPGTEQYGMKISAAGGSGAVVAPYDTANYALDTAAFPDICASSAGVSATTTYTMTYMANIAVTTEPGTYTARHTYIAIGNF